MGTFLRGALVQMVVNNSGLRQFVSGVHRAYCNWSHAGSELL